MHSGSSWKETSPMERSFFDEQDAGNASEVFFVLGILLTIAGVIFREIRRAKDPYKGRAVATVVELSPGKPDKAGKEAGVHDYYYPVMSFYLSLIHI